MLTPLELANKRTAKVMARRAVAKAKRRNKLSYEIGRTRHRARLQLLADRAFQSQQRHMAEEVNRAQQARLRAHGNKPKGGLLAKLGRFFGRGS